MPIYEMPVLLRVMNKTETVSALKRVANAIFQTGGYIRKIENWGEKELPCKMASITGTCTRANHFLFCFDVPPSSLTELRNEYERDMDVIRTRIYKQNQEPENIVCTLEEELLPPAYRPSILKLLELAKKQKTKKYEFRYNSGLDYYPFLK